MKLSFLKPTLFLTLILLLWSCGTRYQIKSEAHIEELAHSLNARFSEQPIVLDKTVQSLIQLEEWMSTLPKGEQIELIPEVGAYFGESLIHKYGGKWKNQNDSFVVEFDIGGTAFPFSKVEKFVVNGPEDSFSSMFKVLESYLK